MRVLTNLLFKVTLSSMIVSAPAMISNKDAKSGSPSEKDILFPSYSSSVIKKFVNHTTLTTTALYPEVKENANSAEAIAKAIETKMVVSEAVILYDYMSLE